MHTWWLSFANPDEEGGFLGVVLVEAEDMMDALQAAWKAKVNPGGEVRGYPLNPDDPGHKLALDNLPRMQLLSRKVLEKYGESTLSSGRKVH